MAMMTPEGAPAQDIDQPKGPGGDPSGGIAEGISALSQGSQALLEGLTQAKAPPQLIQLAQTAAQALAQIESAMGGAEEQGEPASNDIAGQPPAGSM